jgi:hypothetical protein
MSALLLIPGFISLLLVLRGRIATAFLSVYLPCLLCLPDDYQLRIPHLPPVSPALLALIPIGVAGIVLLIRGGSFALMDLLVLLYSLSIGVSEILHAPVRNDGIFSAFGAFISIFLAYLAGRTLIEPDLRFVTVRLFVILVLLDGIPGLYEWRMGQSLYGLFGQRILGITTIKENVQMRNGHGRMGELFSNSEDEGIAFAMIICVNAWLVHLRKIQSSLDLGKTLTILEKYHVPALLLLLYLWMTQARGPLIGLAAGYLILQIPRFKRTKIMTIVVASLLIAGYLATSKYFASYQNLDPTAMTEQQGSALYRIQMNKLYAPIAEMGGWTGWGMLEIPQIEGMKSIDNQYLLVHLAWGRLAYILFVLIVFENLRVLLVRSWQLDAPEDRSFIFSMLAAMAVLWFTILTVFMGGQLPQVAFLLIGWIQSVRRNALSYSGAQVAEDRNEKFSFRRVFT